MVQCNISRLAGEGVLNLIYIKIALTRLGITAIFRRQRSCTLRVCDWLGHAFRGRQRWSKIAADAPSLSVYSKFDALMSVPGFSQRHKAVIGVAHQQLT